MNTVVLIEKRRKIGEIEGDSIYAWEYFETVHTKHIADWCKQRGFHVPCIKDTGFHTAIDYNYRATYLNVSKG